MLTHNKRFAKKLIYLSGKSATLCQRRHYSRVLKPTGRADASALRIWRSELLYHWGLGIFLEAPFGVTIARAARRDGSSPNVNAPDNRRYVEGQQLCLRTCDPKRAATIVVNNEDLEAP